MALTNVSQEKFQSVTPSLPAVLEGAADEQKFAELEPGLNLSGALGEPVVEQQPASAHQRLDEDNAKFELIFMDGEEVRFETDSEQDSAAVSSGDILSGAPGVAAALGEILSCEASVLVLAQHPHSDLHLSEVKRPLPLDVGLGLTSDERPHSLSPGTTSRWVAKGKRILQALYQSNDADLKITFNEEGFPQLPQCMSGEITDLHVMFEAERQELARPAALVAGVCADVNQGVRSLFSTFDQREQFDKSRNDYLAAIICITWALHEHAEVRVSRGSYKIGDQNHKLYEFLVNFVRFANKTVSPSAIMPYGSSCLHPIRFFAGYGYSRTAYSRTPETLIAGSSHYERNSDQFGIDVRFGLGETSLPLLPNGGTHILFGDVTMMGEKLTFLKIEEAGLGTLGDLVEHTFSFAHSGVVAADSRREKDNPLMPEWIAFCQAARMPHNPKEQIPVHQMYLLMNSHELHKMHLDMGGHLQLTNPVQIARQAFLLKAIDLYGPDISLLAFRTGNEVYLDLRNGFKSSVELDSSRAWTMEGRTPHVGSTHGFFRQEGEAAVLETLMLIDEEKRQESSPKAIVLCELSRATVNQDAVSPASQSDSPSKGP